MKQKPQSTKQLASSNPDQEKKRDGSKLIGYNLSDK